jgi:hypothetical protein
MTTEFDTANPRNPINYRPHPMGYTCRDCNASASLGQAVRHTGRCDVAPKLFVLPADQAEGSSSKRASKRGKAPNQLAKRDAKRPGLHSVAKDGSARLYYTDAEIAQGVRRGEISESDAMNQDF